MVAQLKWTPSIDNKNNSLCTHTHNANSIKHKLSLGSQVPHSPKYASLIRCLLSNHANLIKWFGHQGVFEMSPKHIYTIDYSDSFRKFIDQFETQLRWQLFILVNSLYRDSNIDSLHCLSSSIDRHIYTWLRVYFNLQLSCTSNI